MNVYIFNGAYSTFYLMHHKILKNMGFISRVQIKGIWISEGLLNYIVYIVSQFLAWGGEEMVVGKIA